jgi:hypothetical protein
MSQYIASEDDDMIYAVDFDGTISMGEWPEVGPANSELIDYLIDKQRKGDKLILWTCRVGEPLEKAVEFCKTNGLVFDAVNDNLPETIERYGSNSRKITCDIYLDDRACRVDEYDLYDEVDIDRIERALIKYADGIKRCKAAIV